MRGAAAASALLLGACATVPPDRGFATVQTELAQRGEPAIPAPADDDAGALADRILLQGPLTADGAVHIALLRNPRLRAEYARLGIGAAEVYDAGRLANPSIGGSAMITRSPDRVDRYDFGITQNFVDLLLLPARKRLAAAEFARTEEQAGGAIVELSAETRAAYYQLVAAQQTAELRERAAAAADASAQLTQRYVDAGNIPPLALDLERAEDAEAGIEALAARNTAALARAALSRLLGISEDRADWQAPARLPDPPASDDDEVALQALAQTGRLDLRAAREEVAAREDAERVARSSRWIGGAEFGVQGERDTDRTHLLGPSASAQIPLFNQGQGTVLRAQAQLELGRAQLAELELDVGQSIHSARLRLGSARELVERYDRDLLPLRARIVEQTQQQANFMLSGPFELIRAKRQEYDTGARAIEALRDYWEARVDLSRAVGTRLPSESEKP